MGEHSDGRVHRRRGSETAASAVAALVALLTVGDADPATAHARLLRSAPAAAQRLTAPPLALDLWFNELLDERFNGIELFTVSLDGRPGRRIDIGPPAVDPVDRTHLTAAVPPLSPGRYVAHWRVLSRDGHPVRGRLEFAVAGDAPPAR